MIRFFTLTLLGCCGFLQAQNFGSGKVSVSELEQKVHPLDTSAVAAILFEIGETGFGTYSMEVTTKVRLRIKIYKKEGYDWANKSISFMKAYGMSVSDAATYNLENGKIIKTKLTGEGIFEERINKYWSRKKISMPNVREGSVIEMEYKVDTPAEIVIQPWKFQTGIPVNYSEYSTIIPEKVIFSAVRKGYIFPKIVEQSVQRGPETFKKTTYTMTNVPAMKDEAYVNNIENYRASIYHELSGIQDQYGFTRYLTSDWDKITELIYKSPDFGDELKKTAYFAEDIDKLIAGITDERTKAEIIFNYVRSEIKWNEDYGFYCDEGVKSAYKEKTGNVAEINLMLTAMLRYAGINANPVLLSTRENGIPLFARLMGFDYVISAIEQKESVILLDATEEYAMPNVLPLRDINWYGRIIRKDGTSAEIDLIPGLPSKELVSIMVEVGHDGRIAGKIKRVLTDHKAMAFRDHTAEKTTEAYLEELESENNNIEITDYLRENEKDLLKPVSEAYTLTDLKSAEVIGDKMYIAPLLFFTVTENPFIQEKREYPIDFGYPVQQKYTLSIGIPEGYEVESLPAGLNAVTENDLCTFKYMIGNAGSKIQISVLTDITKAIVPAQYYEILKGFFQEMIDKQKEKIILRKKN